MSVDDQSADSPPFKDRSTGLAIFGALQIVMGVCYALLIPLILLSLWIGPSRGHTTSVRMLIPALGMYALLAVLLIWLGVGSIRARRWARALTLVLAWMWLVMGVMSLIAMSVWMPNMSNLATQENQVPPQAMIFVQVVMLGTMGCMYLRKHVCGASSVCLRLSTRSAMFFAKRDLKKAKPTRKRTTKKKAARKSDSEPGAAKRAPRRGNPSSGSVRLRG